MFVPILIIIITLGLFAVRNVKIFNLYLITLSILGGYFFITKLTTMFIGRL